MPAQEKTEKPTAKKRKESRKEGQVPRTPELGAWLALLAIGLAAPVLLPAELHRLAALLQSAFRVVPDATAATDLALLGRALGHALLVVVLLGSVVLLVGFAAAVAQGGFYLATKAVKPSAAKLNPIKGVKRIFGPQALWEGAKMLLKSAVVGLFVWGAVTGLMPLLGGLVPPSAVVSALGDHARGLFRDIAVAGVVMAAADYAMARRRIGKQIRMTKEEVKQEHKQSEGDPLVKSAIRSRQLAAARNRMMRDVPEADVVLVNPTHVAVALRYDPDHGAPRVVARGAGVVAQRIREVAADSRVPLVRDVPLARALYTSTKVGQEIPAELFAAVAQVLAFVISRRRSGQYGGQHRSPRLGPDLPEVSPVRRRRPARSPAASTAANRSGTASAGR